MSIQKLSVYTFGLLVAMAASLQAPRFAQAIDWAGIRSACESSLKNGLHFARHEGPLWAEGQWYSRKSSADILPEVRDSYNARVLQANEGRRQILADRHLTRAELTEVQRALLPDRIRERTVMDALSDEHIRAVPIHFSAFLFGVDDTLYPVKSGDYAFLEQGRLIGYLETRVEGDRWIAISPDDPAVHIGSTRNPDSSRDESP